MAIIDTTELVHRAVERMLHDRGKVKDLTDALRVADKDKIFEIIQSSVLRYAADHLGEK